MAKALKHKFALIVFTRPFSQLNFSLSSRKFDIEVFVVELIFKSEKEELVFLIFTKVSDAFGKFGMLLI